MLKLNCHFRTVHFWLVFLFFYIIVSHLTYTCWWSSLSPALTSPLSVSRCPSSFSFPCVRETLTNQLCVMCVLARYEIVTRSVGRLLTSSRFSLHFFRQKHAPKTPRVIGMFPQSSQLYIQKRIIYRLHTIWNEISCACFSFWFIYFFFAHFWLGFPFSLDADGLHWTGLDNIADRWEPEQSTKTYPQFSFWFVRNQLQYRCMCTLRTLEIGQVGTIRHPSMTMLNWKKQKNIWDMETRSLFISHSAIVSLYIRHSLHTQWSALLNSFIIKVMGMKNKNLIEK